MPRTLVLFSGGLDSTALLYSLIHREGQTGVAALSVNYGQRHSRELTAGARIAELLSVPRFVVDLSDLGGKLSSCLTQGGDVPEGHYAADSMKSTVVPYRNGLFILSAAAVAASKGFDTVALANHGGDHFVYADCRPAFVDAMQQVLTVGVSESPVVLAAPFTNLTKAEIIKAVPNAPYALTWSCYNGREKHCGLCKACVERKEAFQLAGKDDPTEYEN